MVDDPSEPYRTEAADRGFVVLDASDRVVVSCADEPSATEYASLLAEAYRRGYKAGYRDGRKP